MRHVRPIILTTIGFLIYSTAIGQLISKKESGAVNKILTESSEQFKPQTYIIQNVSVLTMKDSVLLQKQSVLVENGVIQEIGANIQRQNATIIDGTARFLMPGLTDMHIHLFDAHPLKNTWILHLIINGVTSVRDLYGTPEKLVLREQIRRNVILAPNLYQSGQMINGTKDKYAAYAPTATQGREIVKAHKQAGYDFIKVYDGLSKDVYKAIIEESKRQDIPVVGHVPDEVTISETVALGQHSIEHLTGYFEWKNNQANIAAGNDYAEVTAASSVWNCPTIYNHYLNGSRSAAANVIDYAETSGLLPGSLKDLWKRRANNASKDIIEIVDKYGGSNFQTLKGIVLNLYNSNAKLIAGTDAGNLPFLIPGHSLHQELRLMADLGIPTFEVLKMATANAALAMGKENEFGTIEVGKRADLLLLSSNPLHNIENLQKKSGMMIRGIWLSEDDIEKLTGKLKSAFAD